MPYPIYIYITFFFNIQIDISLIYINNINFLNLIIVELTRIRTTQVVKIALVV